MKIIMQTKSISDISYLPKIIHTIRDYSDDGRLTFYKDIYSLSFDFAPTYPTFQHDEFDYSYVVNIDYMSIFDFQYITINPTFDDIYITDYLSPIEMENYVHIYRDGKLYYDTDSTYSRILNHVGLDSIVYRKFLDYELALEMRSIFMRMRNSSFRFNKDFSLVKFYRVDKFKDYISEDGTISGHYKEGYEILVSFTDVFNPIGFIKRDDISYFLSNRVFHSRVIAGVGDLQHYQKQLMRYDYKNETFVFNTVPSTVIEFVFDGRLYFSPYDFFNFEGQKMEVYQVFYSYEDFSHYKPAGVSTLSRFDTYKFLPPSISKCCIAECFGITE